MVVERECGRLIVRPPRQQAPLLKPALRRQPSRLDARRWRLYLADWGYNTPEERAAAAELPGVRVISLPEFFELLRWGIVMQVSRAGVSC